MNILKEPLEMLERHVIRIKFICTLILASHFCVTLTPLSSICDSFSKTMAGSSQLTVYKDISESIIPDLLNLMTNAENLLHKNVTGDDNANMLDHLKKLIEDLKKVGEFFMKPEHKSSEATLVKTVLERILHELSKDLGTDDSQVRAVQLNKAKLDELNGIVSNLMLQLPVLDSVKVSVTVSSINRTIIPAVVARLDLAKKYSPSQHAPDEKDSNSGKEGSSPQRTEEQVQKLMNDLSYIRSFLKNLQDNSNNLRHRLENFEKSASIFVNALLRHSAFDSDDLGQAEPKQLQAKLGVLNKVVIKLKQQISLPNKLSAADSDDNWYTQVSTALDYSQVLDILPVLHVDERFTKSSAFRDFREVFDNLELPKRLCLMCFAIIPENEEVKKRFMTHWWVGEGFVSPLPEKTYEEVEDSDGEGFVSSLPEKTYEEVANGIFEELQKKNCIEPVDEKFRSVVNSYKMNPFIRSALIVLAREARFFDFDDKGNPSANCTSSYRACLVDGFNSQGLFKSKDEVKSQSESKSQSETKSQSEPASKSESKSGTGSDAQGTGPGLDTEKRKSKNEVKSQSESKSKSEPAIKSESKSGLDAEKLQVIFNVNEPYPDVFELEWFSKLKNLKVLYLGRWQTSAKHHIEVESTEFLTGLKGMKLLWFFSLQGISRITKLPDSVCKLLNLRVLDLRACHNLEELPDGIGKLRNLTHLDISECYLLDYLPKEIGTLSKLLVLKGFVISDHNSHANCTLDHLSKLEKLRKLSIYTNTEAFPKYQEVATLVKFKALLKLTITWGAGAFLPKGASQPKAATTTSPQEIEDKINQEKGVAQSIMTAITTTLKNRCCKSNQDKDVAPSTAADNTVFEKLHKLDLKCYPCKTAPSWLLPGNLPELKKLYIRGGNLQNLSSVQENDKWPYVEVLRLKFLSELKMDWKKLRSSFPGLIYFEKFKCPKLTYFPCNEKGVVWLQKP